MEPILIAVGAVLAVLLILLIAISRLFHKV